MNRGSMKAFGLVVVCLAGMLFAAGAAAQGMPLGPPANLRGQKFQSVVEEMWRDSATFRRQCQRLVAATDLTVTIRAEPRGWPAPRARTFIGRKRGIPTSAEVVLAQPSQAIELIAHELEHVIEQLDSVELRTASCLGRTSSPGEFESCRALEAGRRVAREVDEARRARTATFPLENTPATRFEPASWDISANGAFVVFTSFARLVPTDVNNQSDLYLFDLLRRQLHLLTPRPGWADNHGTLHYPRISGDGRMIALEAIDADDASPNGFRFDILVVDRATGRAQVIDTGAAAHAAMRISRAPQISRDGSTVVFESWMRAGAARVQTSAIYAARLSTGIVEPVAIEDIASPTRLRGLVSPVVSADGRYVAFAASADFTCEGMRPCDRDGAGTARPRNIYVRDTVAGVTTRVSRTASGAIPNGASFAPAISGDGRYVAFVSSASNLSKHDDNQTSDVFVYDRTTGVTELVSRRRDGRAGSDASLSPSISANGAVIAFQSRASDLVCDKGCAAGERDINLLTDVFVFDRMSRTMIRASADPEEEWMAESRRPVLDGSGRVVVFGSRQPIDGDDWDNDEDLYVMRIRTPIESTSDLGAVRASTRSSTTIQGTCKDSVSERVAWEAGVREFALCEARCQEPAVQ